MLDNLYRQIPHTVTANQWFKNGDHPLDAIAEDKLIPAGYEGRVVRYFRDPALRGTGLCELCSEAMHVHGWIDTVKGGYVVCPGDWVVTEPDDSYTVYKPGVFKAKYKRVW